MSRIQLDKTFQSWELVRIIMSKKFQINESIDSKDYDEVEECSLYRAVCYVAFGERPIEEKYAELLYPQIMERCESELFYVCDISNNLLKKACSKSNITIREEEFFEAARALRIKLIEGKIEANGYELNKPLIAWSKSGHANEREPDDMVFTSDEMPERQKIAPYRWEQKKLIKKEIDWGLSSLKIISPGWMSPYEKSAQYTEIKINTKDLKNTFTIHKTTSNKRGPKPQFDWEKFYIEIIRIANEPDGLPESPAELIKIMEEWCDNNWPNSPGETSMKNKIYAVYQWLNEGQ